MLRGSTRGCMQACCHSCTALCETEILPPPSPGGVSLLLCCATHPAGQATQAGTFNAPFALQGSHARLWRLCGAVVHEHPVPRATRADRGRLLRAGRAHLRALGPMSDVPPLTLHASVGLTRSPLFTIGGASVRSSLCDLLLVVQGLVLLASWASVLQTVAVRIPDAREHRCCWNRCRHRLSRHRTRCRYALYSLFGSFQMGSGHTT